MRRLTLLTVLLAAIVAWAPVPARASQSFIVFFTDWSAGLDRPAEEVVAAAATHAQQNPAMRVEVFGFASTEGSQRANLYLSLLRAQLVSDLLEAAGIAPARISRVGEGSVSSVGSTQEARRVEIIVRAP